LSCSTSPAPLEQLSAAVGNQRSPRDRVTDAVRGRDTNVTAGCRRDLKLRPHIESGRLSRLVVALQSVDCGERGPVVEHEQVAFDMRELELAPSPEHRGPIPSRGIAWRGAPRISA
jgi:hypothetical protein